MKQTTKAKRDYAKEIDKALSEYESFKLYPQFKLSWISNRIVWCWKFKHITDAQKDEFCDRFCEILEMRTYEYC